MDSTVCVVWFLAFVFFRTPAAAYLFALLMEAEAEDLTC